MKENNKRILVLVIILFLLVVRLGGFIIYDKVIVQTQIANSLDKPNDPLQGDKSELLSAIFEVGPLAIDTIVFYVGDDELQLGQAETWSELKDELDNAKSVFDNPNATQAMIDRATHKLRMVQQQIK
jgi:hypothetical protein